VGVGLSNPSEKLDVAGNIRASGSVMANALSISGLDCTANANGGALTADASGVISCSDDDAGITTETDPVYAASPAAGIAGADVSNWNTAHGWGDHSGAGYLTSYTETDPVYGASPAAGIAGADITNWNTAYGWGDHSAQGYVTTDTVLTEAQVEGYVTNGTLDMNNNPITNIGAAGTDFTATGGMRLADDLRIDKDLGIGTDPLPGTERNIYMYDGGIYSDPQIYISGHNSAILKLERRRTDSSLYWLRAGCGSVNCPDDFAITHSTAGTCIAIRNGCDVDIPNLEADIFDLNPTDSPGTCDGTTEGRVYYDDSLAEPCFCNGSEWRQFDGGGTC
jgi:hypothetical protein